MPIPDTITVPAARSPFRVGFCGNINAPLELRTMKAVVEGKPGFRMQLFTPATPAQLESWGLTGPHIDRDFKATSADLQLGLAGCDALFLPLPFDSKHTDPREIETALPTKAFDYLASGRPILVHCPARYYMARFFREHGAALVVDSPEPGAVLEGLRKLRSDERSRQQLAQRGLEVARGYQASRIAAELRQDLRALWRADSP